MRPNDTLTFDNGKVTAMVTEVDIDEIKIEFKTSGVIRDNCPVKLSGAKYGMLPLLKPEDVEDIKDIACKHRFDYICLPCTQTGKDIQEMKLSLTAKGQFISVLAKIDTVEAIH